jgi:hypothetical protein
MRSNQRRWSLLDALLLVMALALVAQAGDGAAPSGLPPVTQPKALSVDPDSSRVYIKVSSGGLVGHAHGVAGRLASGKVALGGTGELVFDMRSFVADLPEARTFVGLKGSLSATDQQKVSETMRGKAVLDVARFPVATLAIDTAKPLDGQAAGVPGQYQLEGQLTLHGVARPVRLTATLAPAGTPGAMRLRGSLTILQSEFGITPYSKGAGLIRVADRLEISADLVLR